MKLSSADMLGGHVSVERRYQRSVRLDADLGSMGPIEGYVLHETARAALATTVALVCKGQGAFTWTGPYGGGKSSLALALASLLLPQSGPRALAQSLLGGVVGDALGEPAESWMPVVVTGRRGDPVADLREAVAEAATRMPGRARTYRNRSADDSGRDIIERLGKEARAREGGGVLVLIDEMGKYLEGAADIHFFQDLAEAANRSDGRLIVIGILHQAFDRYAERIGARAQDEWAKIQGRFVDVPIVTAVDEVIDLIGRAVRADLLHPWSRSTCELTAREIGIHRPGTPHDLADRLDACWPLHPVTAALLGPVTRRRFGQNERSLFSFLASAEPAGFGEFLSRTPVAGRGTYAPSDLWDYLRLNHEPAILASPDSHRWIQAVDAVERAARNECVLAERLCKTVAIIDLFRNGSGVVASPAILVSCIGEEGPREVEAALKRLRRTSTVVFRRHLGAYAVYAGSDFDIDAEVGRRLTGSPFLDLRNLESLVHLRPVLAKRHHFRTGAPRWFATSIAEIGTAGLSASTLTIPEDAAGRFVLALSEDGMEPEEAKTAAVETWSRRASGSDRRPVVLGLPTNGSKIRSLSTELAAVQAIQRECSELEGDAVARREVEARAALLSARLEEALRTAFDTAEWLVGDRVLSDEATGLPEIASLLADETFHAAPVIQSELANRVKPSANTVAATRALLSAMIAEGGAPRFGIGGYPAEVGLAETVLISPGLYREVDGAWAFVEPGKDGREDPGRLAPVWRRAEEIFAESEVVPLARLYMAWSDPPFGIRRGLMPILAVAYLLSRRSRIAVYVDGTFQAALTDLVADRILQDPRDVAFRHVSVDGADRQALALYGAAIAEITGQRPTAEPLAVAQALVAFSFRLPGWARHARGGISKDAVAVRHALLHAHDPHDLLSRALPEAVGAEPAVAPRAVRATLVELDGAQTAMLADLQTRMLSALKHRGENFEPLRARATAIQGTAGDDLRLAGFVSRLVRFDGAPSDMEGICGLVTGQPVDSWRDLEPRRAAVQLADYAYRFRRLELFGMAGEAPTQTAVMMMAGVGETERTVVRRAQLALADTAALRPLIDRIKGHLQGEGLDQDRLLAVLAEVAHDLLEDDGETDITLPDPDMALEASAE